MKEILVLGDVHANYPALKAIGDYLQMDRFNRIDYTMLEDRLAALYKRFNLESMTIEDNSIGLPVFDHLRARGLNVLPFHTSNTSKHRSLEKVIPQCRGRQT